MNTTIIRERLAQDTKPFILRLSDGRRLAVPHPDFIAVGRRVVYLVGKDDHTSRIDPTHIFSIEEVGVRSHGAKH
ncbi:MAG: hypothetical protein FJ399_22705 [Verrucomicrobia bacterium]|nr:hypothetical protein [Verrucomicrobiota bacterium]